MNIVDRIFLKLYFPQFNSPPISRFESLFEVLNKKESNKSYTIPYLISPEIVIQGEDKRTSLTIKNIPKNVKKKDLRNLIEKYGNINFLNIVPDPNFPHLMISYLNVINYKSVASIYMGLRKHTFTFLDEIYNIDISYSLVQGKDELKKFFSPDYHSNNLNI